MTQSNSDKITLKEGTKIEGNSGNFEILEFIGHGRFGQVYKVKKLQNNCVFALKILKDSNINEFLNENNNWSKVSSHRNILTFDSSFIHQGRICIVSEFVDRWNGYSSDLEDWFKYKSQNIDFIEETIKLFFGVLQGLQFIHENNVLHMDIKPANILFKENHPLIADFGTARRIDKKETFTHLGSWNYLSPKLFNAYKDQKKFNRKIEDDLWAAAVTFYELLTGESPFTANFPPTLYKYRALPQAACDFKKFFDKAFTSHKKEAFSSARKITLFLLDDWSYVFEDLSKETIIDKELTKRLLKKKENEIREVKKQKEAIERQIIESKNNEEKLQSEISRAHEHLTENEKIINAKDEVISNKSQKIRILEKELRKFTGSLEKFNGESEISAQQLDDEIEDIFAELTSKTEIINPDSRTIDLNRDSLIEDTEKNHVNHFYDIGVTSENSDQEINHFTVAIELKSDFGVDYHNGGECENNIINIDQEITEHFKAVDLNPDFAPVYYNRETSDNNYETLSRTNNVFSRNIELNPDLYVSPKIKFDPLNYKYLNVVIFFIIIAIFAGVGFIGIPNSNVPLFNLGRKSFDYFDYALNCESGEYDCQIENYTKAIELKPDFADAYNRRGNAYKNKGAYDLAIKDFTRAIELKPYSAVPYASRGDAYKNNKNYDQAIKDYTKAIEIKPDLADAYNGRGEAYNNKGNYDLAIRDYTRLIELKPYYAYAYNGRGDAYLKIGRNNLAEMDRRKGQKLNFRMP